ncbi:PEP-CTERM sorting domain-containing protein (plasmid) [Sphingomonas paeninsulae]|jgi:hypothetical protein|uniref:PEP-CTERM sorting domain-containing protein n=1 Tax=Sphingomonas paeninsulae TaxID=2319844 RepID=A0A494TGQ1_SPHPE|nr:FxDxF family PEP-CTERM protein [Sphingomonas paeninsulae]AYJ85026.1 PEP-CTERM sorting domain-containing protein [Sphingomonas paeninsulae]
MRRLLVSTVAAVAAFAVAPAQALTFPAGGFFNTSAGPAGTFSGFFGNSGIASGLFTDTYTFTLPTDGLGSGSVTTSTSFALGITDLDFSSVTINGITAPISYSNSGLTETASASFIPITMLALNTITISGTSRGDGSYGGQLTFVPTSAAPEPGTWAMMILGFGIAGAGLRYRRRSTKISYA